MEVCEYCGNALSSSKFGSDTNLFGSEKTSGGSWLCLPRWCSRKSERDSEILEITTGNVPESGSYNRRKTIQFDLDATYESPSKITVKGRQSILKPAISVKVR